MHAVFHIAFQIIYITYFCTYEYHFAYSTGTIENVGSMAFHETEQ